MDIGTRADFEVHLNSCAACARYDRVVRNGAGIFRDLTEIEPASDFLPRLQHKIFHIRDEDERLGRRASGTSVMFTTAISAMIAAVAWAPLARPRPHAVELPSVAAHAPHRQEAVPVLFKSGPLLDEAQRIDRYNRRSAQTLFAEFSPVGVHETRFTTMSGR